MPERFSDEQLDAVLASVGRHLVVPEGSVSVAALAPVRVSRPTARAFVLAAALLLVVLLVTTALVAPVREAVADWLGIGTTRIEQVPKGVGDPTGLPSFSAGAIPITAIEARLRLGRPLPVITDRTLGTAELLAVPQEGGVLMAWRRGQTTLWLDPSVGSDIGSGPGMVKKLLTIEDQAEPIPDLGEAAVLIEGKHVLQTPARRVAAGRVLIWIEDGVQYRLESDLSRSRMVAIARSVPSRS